MCICGRVERWRKKISCDFSSSFFFFFFLHYGLHCYCTFFSSQDSLTSLCLLVHHSTCYFPPSPVSLTHSIMILTLVRRCFVLSSFFLSAASRLDVGVNTNLFYFVAVFVCCRGYVYKPE
uniref:Uncharacterized protein n=1 Tax=Trypanosoma congolense (strain IL3000) TaxID=1068625 RepID=G0UL15_TRYCI|nr:hypothetical protein, unlikely [Trypanosoma congolense IL3000]